jgi:hypothetical protein
MKILLFFCWHCWSLVGQRPTAIIILRPSVRECSALPIFPYPAR